MLTSGINAAAAAQFPLRSFKKQLKVLVKKSNVQWARDIRTKEPSQHPHFIFMFLESQAATSSSRFDI